LSLFVFSSVTKIVIGMFQPVVRRPGRVESVLLYQMI